MGIVAVVCREPTRCVAVCGRERSAIVPIFFFFFVPPFAVVRRQRPKSWALCGMFTCCLPRSQPFPRGFPLGACLACLFGNVSPVFFVLFAAQLKPICIPPPSPPFPGCADSEPCADRTRPTVRPVGLVHVARGRWRPLPALCALDSCRYPYPRPCPCPCAAVPLCPPDDRRL